MRVLRDTPDGPILIGHTTFRLSDPRIPSVTFGQVLERDGTTLRHVRERFEIVATADPQHGFRAFLAQPGQDVRVLPDYRPIPRRQTDAV